MVESDPDLFDCSACPLRAAKEGLWPENSEAWSLYCRVGARWTRDAGVSSEVFRRLTADVDSEDFADLMDRVLLIHDVVSPERDSGA